MAEMINLRRVRKAKARAAKAAESDASRASHGVAKRERDLAKARAEKEEHDLTSRKLDDKV
jgi:hypothetical protein